MSNVLAASLSIAADNTLDVLEGLAFAIAHDTAAAYAADLDVRADNALTDAYNIRARVRADEARADAYEALARQLRATARVADAADTVARDAAAAIARARGVAKGGQ